MNRLTAYVVGVGARQGASAAEVGALVDQALADARITADAVAHLATLEAKGAEAGIRTAAADRGWPVVTWSAARLGQVLVPTPSALVGEVAGTASVAEAAALLDATGRPTGALIIPKRTSPTVTVAIAQHRA
ncbi:cobalamin biosynthesis protein [Cryptosporangium aurantiacum]|uniref:Cobalt-precorrin 5A hydrolase n=1 Tax=Cryptosporangium aurantiacum TaxID=134849 RepID=A0A1M7Q9T9_9ACTN|nr:cobalamin biosynthesis protein [Cryptosporangium aurantiacum]SHN27093.1 cobalt-precorrin 5A hydrolase [Cryptosporangium aurantiacum]